MEKITFQSWLYIRFCVDKEFDYVPASSVTSIKFEANKNYNYKKYDGVEEQIDIDTTVCHKIKWTDGTSYFAQICLTGKDYSDLVEKVDKFEKRLTFHKCQHDFQTNENTKNDTCDDEDDHDEQAQEKSTKLAIANAKKATDKQNLNLKLSQYTSMSILHQSSSTPDGCSIEDRVLEEVQLQHKVEEYQRKIEEYKRKLQMIKNKDNEGSCSKNSNRQSISQESDDSDTIKDGTPNSKQRESPLKKSRPMESSVRKSPEKESPRTKSPQRKSPRTKSSEKESSPIESPRRKSIRRNICKEEIFERRFQVRNEKPEKLQDLRVEPDILYGRGNKPRERYSEVAKVLRRYKRFDHITKKGEVISSIHLGDGFHIPYESWPFITVQKNSSKFVKYLAEALWGDYQLANSYVKKSSGMAEIEGRSPRKELQPSMIAVLKECFEDRLAKQNLPPLEYNKELRKMGNHLGAHCKSIRSRMYPESVKKLKKQTNAEDSREEINKSNEE